MVNEWKLLEQFAQLNLTVGEEEGKVMVAHMQIEPAIISEIKSL